MNKREWVGLTDEDIDVVMQIAETSFRKHRLAIKGQQLHPADQYDWHLICAVESKLKEKNT
jgi:hypothetical protein